MAFQPIAYIKFATLSFDQSKSHAQFHHQFGRTHSTARNTSRRRYWAFNTINLPQSWFNTMLFLPCSPHSFKCDISESKWVVDMASIVTLWVSEGNKRTVRSVENKRMSMILGWSWGNTIRSSEWSQANSGRKRGESHDVPDTQTTLPGSPQPTSSR